MQVPARIKSFYVPAGPNDTMVVALTPDAASGQQISQFTFCPIPYFTKDVIKNEGRPRARPPGAYLSSSSGSLSNLSFDAPR